MKIYRNLFNNIIKPETLFLAWKEFKDGKSKKLDVLTFERELEQNIFKLARDLSSKTYKHDGYSDFYISDPKRRHIHKATVRDRVLHHAIVMILNPIFEPSFIANSFSCRVGKGAHKGVSALRNMIQKESRNNTKQCYVLKCDVQKFFDSIDHNILLSILRRKIKDPDTMWLVENIVQSYVSTKSDLFHNRGVPIGNLTSQLFANVYMNEFDQFMKHELRVRHYARYTDDFVVVSSDKVYLENLILKISKFLDATLGLNLHPNKVEILPYGKGIDFLGYIIFPRHTLIRKRTGKRILWKFKNKIELYQEKVIEKESVEASLNSYLGVLSHANAYNFSTELKNYFWFTLN
ncbi:MAG: reverse transcriptase/maturase family protein [Candidatus Paceibacterota bacterium]